MIVARDLLVLYLSGHAFAATVAAGVVPVAWAFVIRVDPGQPNFLTAALVIPLVTGVVVLALVAAGPTAGVLESFAAKHFGDRGGIGALLGYLDLRVRGEPVDWARVELPAADNETTASERGEVAR